MRRRSSGRKRRGKEPRNVGHFFHNPYATTRILITRGGNGCWLWQGRPSSNGYGVVTWNGKVQSTHRLAWESAHGPIPDGLQVNHVCDIRNCVRPDHLWLGTQAENMADCVQKGRSWSPAARANKAKTHCLRGHEYTPENTIRNGGGFRDCRICNAARSQANRARRKEREEGPGG